MRDTHRDNNNIPRDTRKILSAHLGKDSSCYIFTNIKLLFTWRNMRHNIINFSCLILECTVLKIVLQTRRKNPHYSKINKFSFINHRNKKVLTYVIK